MVDFMLKAAVASISWMERDVRSAAAQPDDAVDCMKHSLECTMKFILETIGVEGSDTMSMSSMISAAKQYKTYASRMVDEISALYLRLSEKKNFDQVEITELFYRTVSIINRTYNCYTAACVA